MNETWKFFFILEDYPQNYYNYKNDGWPREKSGGF